MWQGGNMKATKFTFFRRVSVFCPSAVLILTMLVLTVSATTAAAQNVFVPGNASGYFGNSVDLMVPFVPAITVNGPGTITVTYVSGTVNTGGGDVGPNGGPSANKHETSQSPLQEAEGIAPHGTIGKVGALIGTFVRQSRIEQPGFKAIDGTKNATRVGIKPSQLFFIGESKNFDVKEAGTLFLGINDWNAGDNSGGFNVTVTGP
jgi:hypothetical protein